MKSIVSPIVRQPAKITGSNMEEANDLWRQYKSGDLFHKKRALVAIRKMSFLAENFEEIELNKLENYNETLRENYASISKRMSIQKADIKSKSST